MVCLTLVNFQLGLEHLNFIKDVDGLFSLKDLHIAETLKKWRFSIEVSDEKLECWIVKVAVAIEQEVK